jgi:UPF0755 protein
MRKALIVLLVLVLLGGLAAGGGALWAYGQWHAAGPLPEATAIVVPRGGTQAIADALAERGVLRDARLLAPAAWITRSQGPLRAGEYQFPAQASLAEVLEVLRRSRPVQRRLTIPEGLTAKQIALLIEAAPGLTGDLPPLAEGGLLPETYSYQYGDSRAALVRRADAAMDAAMERLWRDRAPNLPVATPREALVLASIVERETGQAAERPRVAAVFLNRLRRGMPLQSDPTVAYAAADGAVLDRPLTRADLDRAHPFNTYRNRGLPPGPIASPGEASIAAVLQPADTDELYFVADGTGGHAFGRTLEEHNRNVARWRQIERQRATTP